MRCDPQFNEIALNLNHLKFIPFFYLSFASPNNRKEINKMTPLIMNDVERNVLENADIIFLYKMDPPYG